jgi:hypothetical protein
MAKKIKSEKIYRVEIDPEEDLIPGIEEGMLQSHYEYDDKGNPTLEVQYESDGLMTEKNEYSYNADGKLSGIFIYDDMGEILEKKTIEWGDDGNIISETVHYLDGSVDILQYNYENGKLAEKKLIDDENIVESTEKYTYSEDKLLMFEKLNEEGELVYKHENEYDDEGNLISSSVWSSEDGETFSRYTTYHPNGHRKTDIKYDENERPVEKTVFEENSDGRTSVIIEENTVRKNTTQLEYNDQGQLIRQTETNMIDLLNHEILRDYDSEGNPELTRVRTRIGDSESFYYYALIYEYEYW